MAPKRSEGGGRLTPPAPSRPRKPGLALTSESPARPLSSFSGFGVQCSPPRFAPRQGASSSTGRGASSKPLHTDETSTLSTNGNQPQSAALQGEARSSSYDLWSDRMNPQSKSDLAIHKKKIDQVESWIREALYGKPIIQRYRRILVLSGPAGSGKSTLIKTLSKESELNFQVVEWNEEARSNARSTSRWDFGQSSSYEEYPLSSSVLLPGFSDFLSQSSRFDTLQLVDAAAESEKERPAKSSPRPRLVLLDDLPNLQHEPSRIAFQSSILDVLSRATQIDSRISPPLVIILSECTPRLGEWDASNRAQTWRERTEETMNVRNIFPESATKQAGFAHISFNAVARTILRKCLVSALTNEKRVHANSVLAPTSDKAKRLIEDVISLSNGDIRNALNTLQMTVQTAHSVPTRPGQKRLLNGKIKTESNVKLAALAAGKESSLAIFHAIGKILYNKRAGDPLENKFEDDVDIESEDEGKSANDDEIRRAMDAFVGPPEESLSLPAHLEHFFRRKSLVNTEQIWRSMPTDASTLQVFLHQNFTPFCVDVEQSAGVLESLSYADMLRPSHEEWYHTALTDYYNFLITTHGTLMALPSPMPRSIDQRFRGMAFFDCLRRSRHVREILSDVGSSAKRQSENDEDTYMAQNVITQASVEQLATEVLPLVNLISPLSDDVRACLMDASRSDGRRSESWQTIEDDAEGNEEELLSKLLASSSNEQGQRLYDEDGRRVKVEILSQRSSAEAPISVAASVFRPTLAGRLDKGEEEVGDDDGVIEDEEDEIDDFD